MSVLWQLLTVSIPITIGASFMSLMTVIDSSVVLGRLQSAGGLGLSETAASGLFGQYTRGLTIFNLPPALIVPVSVSIVPAIAAAVARRNAGAATGEAGNIMQSAVKLVCLLAMPASAGLIVLAAPILTALYNDQRETTIHVLMILGAASFFVCLQLVTMAILQANGHERLTMLTIPAGGIVQVVLDYILVGNPAVGIIGSPFGTLSCYAVISTLNIAFIIAKVGERPRFARAFLRPLLCSALMAAAAFLIYRLVSGVGSIALGTGRLAVAVFLAVTIAVAVVFYLVLVVVLRAVTAEDMRLVPKGEKLVRVLQLK
jgi:stage V sporulation protein B